MKICKNCGAQMDDGAMFCTHCGTPWSASKQADAQGFPNQNPYQQNSYNQQDYSYGAGYAFPYDHTAEFTQQDIHDNKVFCLAIYLLGIVGIIIAILASRESPFVAFHVRQALKISVLQTLTGLVSAVLCWTILVPIAGGVFLAILFVVRIICFFRICSGKAIEPPIVRGIGFLN